MQHGLPDSGISMGFLKNTGEGSSQANGGRTIRGYWLLSVIGLLILIVAVWGYLIFQNQQSSHSNAKQQVNSAAQVIAGSIATNLEHQLSLIQSLARQPGLADLINGPDKELVTNEQARMTRLVPDSLLIRLLSTDLNEPDTSKVPSMGYASLMLLRKAEKHAAVQPAELHQFGTSHQHIAIASSILASSGDVAGVIHAAYSVDMLKKIFSGLDDLQGRIEVQQTLSSNEKLVIIGKGEKPASGEEPDGLIPINGSIWQIAYWGDTGVQFNFMANLQLMIPGLLLFLFTALLLFRLSQQMMNALKRDQQTILSLVEAMVVGRIPKGQPAQLGDLQSTLEVVEHQIREFRSAQAEKSRTKREIIASDVDLGIDISEVAVKPVVDTPLAKVTPNITIPPEIYRAYDIRGVVGDTLNDEIVTLLGQGIGSEIFERGFQQIIVARDARNSSERLQSALIQGLQASGRDVIDIGMVPTPLLYYAVNELDAECGVIVTGSHNPPQYNGLKMVVAGEAPSQSEIQDLRRIIDAGQLLQGEGSFDSQEIVNHYIERVASDVRLGQPLKVVVDCGNGAASVVAPELYRQMGCEVVELYCTPRW
jgi:phosphomannomutase/phosphoglucomutase